MIIDKTGRKQVEVGDKISALGVIVTIKEILYQDWYSRNDFNTGEYWDVEFIDSLGNYRHWVSQYDGGKVIAK